MATPGSWIGKTPVPSKIEPEPSWEDQNVNELIENIRPSRPKKTHSASRSNESSSNRVEHAIHENIKTGIFWCDCDGFKSHNEADANYHMMQNSPKMAKKPYIRKPHLTDRPLAENEALKALRDSLPEAEKFNPGKKPRNKENN